MKRSGLELVNWSISDNPDELLKSVNRRPGVRYILCEAVTALPVLKDDAGEAITNADIMKAAACPVAADALRKRVKNSDSRRRLDEMIVKSFAPMAPGYKAVRDADGDGKIHDGTPQEQAAPDKQSQPPAKKIGDKRIEGIRQAAAQIEFTDEIVTGGGDSSQNVENLDNADEAFEHLTSRDMERVQEELSTWAWEEASDQSFDADTDDIASRADLEESDIESKVMEVLEGRGIELEPEVIDDLVVYPGPDGIDGAIEDIGIHIEDDEKAKQIKADLESLKSEVEEAWDQARMEIEDEMRDSYVDDLHGSSEYDEKKLELCKEKLLEDYGWHSGDGDSDEGESQYGIWGKDSSDDYAYKFKISSGDEFEVNCEEGTKFVKEQPYDYSWLTFRDGDGGYGITDKVGPRGAIEVFDNVLKSTAAYVMEKKPDILNFTAAGASRQRLYDRLASSIGAVDASYKVVAFQSKTNPSESRNYYVYKGELQPQILSLIADRFDTEQVQVDHLVKANFSHMFKHLDVFEIPSATDVDLANWYTEGKWQPIKPSKEEIKKSVVENWRNKVRASKKKIEKSAVGRDPRDGDGDGKIFDNTPQERPARDNVGRVIDSKAAASSPEAAREAMARTTRPNQRARLAENLRARGMSDEDIKAARSQAEDHSQNIKGADSPAKLYTAEDKIRLDPKLTNEQKEKLVGEVEKKAEELRNQKRPNSQQSQPTGTDRVLFEAAPDPNDKALADQWRALTDEQRVSISRDVVNAVMPDVASKLGVTMNIHEQLGGYLDDTNPSFAAVFNGKVDPKDFMETMKAAGFAMSQDSMMGISKDPIEGADKAGFVTVELPQGSDAHSVYMQIRSMDPTVQGHTTIGNQMTIVDFTGRHQEIAQSIAEKLNYNTRVAVGYAAFVDKGNYGYGSDQSWAGQSGAEQSGAGQASAGGAEGDRERGVAGLDERRKWGDDLRAKASGIIREGIAAASGQASGKVNGSTTGQSGGQGSVGSFDFEPPDAEGNAKLKKGLKIPRDQLPQIKSEDNGEFLDWLKSSGVGVSTEQIDPKSLTPIQENVSRAKIDEMKSADKSGSMDVSKKPVMVSNDGHLIDGHHRAIAAAELGKNMTATKIDLPAKDLIAKLNEFPKKVHEGINASRYYAKFASNTASKFQVSDPNGKDTWYRYASNPKDMKNPGFHADRVEMHNKIKDELLGSVQPVPEGEQPIALIMGGGSGAGKSSILDKGLVKLPGQLAKVDSDHIKSMLPDYSEMVGSGDAAAIERAAKFNHEESSYVAKNVMAESLKTRRNTLLDGTGNGEFQSLKSKVDAMRAAGHKVVGQYVTINLEEASKRAKERAQKTGRFVPQEVVLKTHRSVSQVFPMAVAEGLFDQWQLWDNDGPNPVLVGEGGGSTGKIHDREAWHRFLSKTSQENVTKFGNLFEDSGDV